MYFNLLAHRKIASTDYMQNKYLGASAAPTFRELRLYEMPTGKILPQKFVAARRPSMLQVRLAASFIARDPPVVTGKRRT